MPVQCPTHFSQATSETRLFRRTQTCPLYRPVGLPVALDYSRTLTCHLSCLNKGYAIRDVAKLTGKGISTVQRVKKEFVA